MSANVAGCPDRHASRLRPTRAASVGLDILGRVGGPLAERSQQVRARRTTGPRARPWLTTAEAAAHLSMTPNALHKSTASRAIPFRHDRPGGKCWFTRSVLDARR